MNTTDLGRLGEVRAASELVKQGWYVFTDISGKCPIDIIAWKDGKTLTFQVKATALATAGGSYKVQVGRVRSNRTGSVVYNYDVEGSDYLAVYIQPLDVVCFVKSTEVLSGRQLNFREEISKFNSNGRVIRDYLIV